MAILLVDGDEPRRPEANHFQFEGWVATVPFEDPVTG